MDYVQKSRSDIARRSIFFREFFAVIFNTDRSNHTIESESIYPVSLHLSVRWLHECCYNDRMPQLLSGMIQA